MEQRVLRTFFGLRDASVRLEAGRSYGVVGIYESPFPHTLPAVAMAHIVGIFEPDDLAGWQELDRASIHSQNDLQGLPDPLEAEAAPYTQSGRR